MGRTLDSLKQGDVTRPVNPKVAITPTQDDCVVDWTLPDEDVPFVEVGGPGKKVEFSPGLVTTHPPQTRPQPPHAPTERPHKAVEAVELIPTKPMAVAYEPWQETPAAATKIAAEILTHHQPSHPISKQYLALFDKILSDVKPPVSYLLTGLHANVGTTTVLLNLAVSAASERQHRVVAVDTNLRNPSIARRLGMSPRFGVQDLTAGTAALEQSVCKSPIPLLSVLPALVSQANDGLTTEAISWLMTWLRQRFDLVLVDSPTLEHATELSHLSPHCDGVFLVMPHTEMTNAHRGPAQSILRAGGKLRGFIHTHVVA